MAAQTQGRAKLREGVSDDDQAAMTDAATLALDRIVEEDGIDARGFKFAVEDLAYHFFQQTGDAETAAEDAARLFADQLGTFALDGGEVEEGPFGNGLLHFAAARGGGERVTTGDIDDFFEESDVLNDSDFASVAREFGMNADRALLARDILRAAREGMTEAQKKAFIGRAEKSDRSVFFHKLISSFDVGRKFSKKQTKAGILVFENIFDDGGEKTDIEKARDSLAELMGRGGSGRVSPRLGVTRGGSIARSKKQKNPEKEFDVKLPKVSATKNPLTKAEFNGLSDRGKIDPNRIRPMQDTIDRDFQDGRSLERMVRQLLDGSNKPIKAIRIAVVGEHVFTLDHRRLIAHRLAGKDIQYQKASPLEIRRALKGKRRKMSTQNSGMLIEVLERKKQ